MQAGAADWLANGVRRILAPNPSAMTGPGTNSYLLGTGSALVLVDPGPLIEAHISALLAALAPGESIARILVTHAHLDHSAAAPRLSALTGAPVLAFGDATSGRSATMRKLAAAGLSGGGEGLDHSFRPDIVVTDGQDVALEAQPLRVIHTPGHIGGHICLAFGDVLLSGDHAMGWASSLISPPDGDMGAYMASLARLERGRWSQMLPGHGAEVNNVSARLAALRDHRHLREASLLAALSDGPATPKALTARIYTDTPVNLRAAAQRNVLAHLIDLTERKLVTTRDFSAPDSIFTKVAETP